MHQSWKFGRWHPPVILGWLLVSGLSPIQPVWSQSTTHLPLEIAQVTPPDRPLSDDLEPAPLPPPENYLQPPKIPQDPSDSIPEGLRQQIPSSFQVENIQFQGNTVFNNEILRALLEARASEGEIAFTDLLQLRVAIDRHYADAGYATSGVQSFQFPKSDSVIIHISEGRLESIQVTGNQRLDENYIQSRLRRFTTVPLNIEHLLDGLRLLQTDPLIAQIESRLIPSPNPGENILTVKVEEEDSLSGQITLNNERSPSIGSFQRRAQITEANLLGLGDQLSVGYSNTSGSNGIDVSYTLPINPHDGTFQFLYGQTWSKIVESPFDTLDIESTSRYFDLSLRQPLVSTPSEEFALGLTVSHRESNSRFLEALFGVSIPFPSPGADAEGDTRVSAVRFSQEWSKRSQVEAFALRSQLSLGVDLFDATLNEGDIPDSQFLSWRGQAQWRRRLSKDSFLLARGDVQMADRPLLPFEQFGLGGNSTVRGYRQDLLLADNGVFGSVEAWIPVLRIPEVNGVLQVTPFVDGGVVWNNSNQNLASNELFSVGLGLRWQQDDLTARLNWGIPLISVDSAGDSLQENGVYLSVNWFPF